MSRSKLPLIPKNWTTDSNKTKSLRVKTYSYFNYDEVSSALQKAVRRGFEDEALQWSIEMFFTNSKISNTNTNLWNRLLTIAVEDIGPSNSNLVIQIYNLLKTNKNDKLAIASIAVELAKNKKCRMNDWPICVKNNHFEEFENEIKYWKGDEEERRDEEEPDYLIFSKKPKYILYDLKNELKVALINKDSLKSTRIINVIASCNYKAIGKCRNPIIVIWEAFFEINNNIFVKTIYELFKSSNWKFKDKGFILINHVCHCIIYNLTTIPITDLQIDSSLDDKIEKIIKRENLLGVPEYAQDIHTMVGRCKGKDINDFINEGSICNNEDEQFIKINNKYLTNFKINIL